MGGWATSAKKSIDVPPCCASRNGSRVGGLRSPTSYIKTPLGRPFKSLCRMGFWGSYLAIFGGAGGKACLEITSARKF